jgi:hypothetical protein
VFFTGRLQGRAHGSIPGVLQARVSIVEANLAGDLHDFFMSIHREWSAEVGPAVAEADRAG